MKKVYKKDFERIFGIEQYIYEGEFDSDGGFNSDDVVITDGKRVVTGGTGGEMIDGIYYDDYSVFCDNPTFVADITNKILYITKDDTRESFEGLEYTVTI